MNKVASELYKYGEDLASASIRKEEIVYQGMIDGLKKLGIERKRSENYYIDKMAGQPLVEAFRKGIRGLGASLGSYGKKRGGTLGKAVQSTGQFAAKNPMTAAGIGAGGLAGTGYLAGKD